MADAIVSKPNDGPGEDDVMTPSEEKPVRKPRAAKAKPRAAARKANNEGVRTFSGAKRTDV